MSELTNLIHDQVIEIQTVLLDKKKNIITLQILCDRTLSWEDEDNIRHWFHQNEFEESIEIVTSLKQKKLNEEILTNLVNEFKTEFPNLFNNGNSVKLRLHQESICIDVYNKTLIRVIEQKDLTQKIRDKLQKIGVNVSSYEIKICEKEENVDDFLVKKQIEDQMISQMITQQVEEAPESKKETVEFSIGRKIKNELIKISSLDSETVFAHLEGLVDDVEIKEIKDKKFIVSFSLYDRTGSIFCKAFWSQDKKEAFEAYIESNGAVSLEGKYTYDDYAKCNVIVINSITKGFFSERTDREIEKRIELRAHTQMSQLDGFVSSKALIKRALEWGHEAIGITDKYVVQAFPEIQNLTDGKKIKPLYGVEIKKLPDKLPVIYHAQEQEYQDFVVFDIETTGFSKVGDRITEIGAVKIQNGEIVDVFQQLVCPGINIPHEVVELTGISNEMVANEPEIETVLPHFLNFCADAVLVAHNALFDVGFLKANARRMNLNFDPIFIDTMNFSRVMLPHLARHRLDSVAKELGVLLENHHRASDDATATAHIFLKLLEKIDETHSTFGQQLNQIETDYPIIKQRGHDALVFAQTQEGLRNLYQIVSKSHMDYFYREPGVPVSLIEQHRKGLLIGSGNHNGELFQAISDCRSRKVCEEIASHYDFLEVQSPQCYLPLIENRTYKELAEIESIIETIVDIGSKLEIPVVATGDVYFLEPEDHLFRQIVQHSKKMGKSYLSNQYYLKNTNEMLDEFTFLGQKTAREIVIDNPKKIANTIECLVPIPDGTYPPYIEGSDAELKNITYERAHAIYGDPLPQIVHNRLDRELESIIKHGFAVLYIIAQKLVWKSNEDGYLVGSRGSVGSSFAATMAGITEVNPLPPHYVCPQCHHSKFIEDGSYESGIDMPDQNCPSCGCRMDKDGHNIPFEVFLGFDGDKEPDIDLNFAGEYQPICHKTTEEIFGQDKVFRAGTIGTIAENTAYGYIKKYVEEKNIQMHPAEIKRLTRGIVGTKRTTGQHPGGLMVVPYDKNIHDFSPINYPADDAKSSTITTHFNYKAISGRILKLDLLGHDVPSIIRMISDLTAIDPLRIPLDDPRTMSLFVNSDALQLVHEKEKFSVGTLGIPEFGTHFVRQMLLDTKPTTFSELVRISGLSHGTDVWLNNAQDLVRNQVAKLKDVICTRDDIMTYLILKGLENKKAFKIMETVRKGKLLDEDTISYMNQFKLPEWYIDSCQKIQYMFPKAHAVAYVLMSYRIAYFKVYHPAAFYATYFTIKRIDFPGSIILSGSREVSDKMKEIQSLGRGATAKEISTLNVLEVAHEMYCRDIPILKVKFGRSRAKHFTVEENAIVPPYCSLEGVSEATAQQIEEEWEKQKFLSVEDFTKRTKANKAAVEALRAHGLFEGYPNENQLDLFSGLL